MSRCLLGEKKTRRCAEIIRRPVSYATVRGGGPHFVALVAVPIPSTAHPFHEEWRVNYRTGEFHRIDPMAEHEEWQRRHDAEREQAWRNGQALNVLRASAGGSIADDLRSVVAAFRG